MDCKDVVNHKPVHRKGPDSFQVAEDNRHQSFGDQTALDSHDLVGFGTPPSLWAGEHHAEKKLSSKIDDLEKNFVDQDLGMSLVDQMGERCWDTKVSWVVTPLVR